jgi:SM-20-related protein
VDINSLCGQLTEQSWVVQPDFISPDMVVLLREDLKLRQQNGDFKRAAISKGRTENVNVDVRSDAILWLEENASSGVQQGLFVKIQDLRRSLNSQLYLGLRGFEGHYAAYPSGGFYQRHLDAFNKENLRTVSLVLYLNETWKPDWGGQLRIFDGTQAGELATDVLPTGGSLVLFMSSEIEHEVVPSSVERLSFTGWFLQAIV